MSDDEARQDRRLRCRIGATLLLGTAPVELLTSDVSYRGVFLRCDDPPPLRQLVRIKMLLPPDETEVIVQGVVIHVQEPEVAIDAPPGFGVKFIGFEGAVRRAWEAFVRFVATSYPQSEQRPVTLAPPELVDRIHRRHPRHRVELRVHLQTLDDLKTLVTDDISRGGAFIRTDMNVAPGSPARVHVVHPHSEEIFALDGVIARVERGVRAGVAIQFTDITDEMREALMTFIAPVVLIDGSFDAGSDAAPAGGRGPIT